MDTITSIVKADPEACGRTIKLSQIDQIAPRDYVVHFTCFRLCDGEDKERIFKRLETGLLNATKEIPQTLCSVRKCQNDREELELVYSSTSGATIVFKDYTCTRSKASWPHGSYDDLERQHFPLSKLERHLLLPLDNASEPDQFPSLALQANFIQGGLILTSCLHHTVCDGNGIYKFHKILARHTAAAAMKAETPIPCPTPVANNGQQWTTAGEVCFTERTTIIPPEPGVCLDDLPNWKLANARSKFLDPTSYKPALLPQVKYATYFISGQNLARLRSNLRGVSGSRMSIIEALGAFLWMHVLRARNIDTERYPQAKLSITVDARSRMTDRAVSPRYWGNFSEPNAVACLPTAFLHDQTNQTGDLGVSHVSCPEAPGNMDWSVKLPEAARRIKQAIAAVDNTAVRRLVGLLNQMPKATSLTWNVDRWPGPDMLIVCSHKSFYNQLDHGPGLGCSDVMRHTVGNTEGKPDGRCLLMPPRNGDGEGLEVALQYDVDTLERLEQSKDFAEFLERRN